MLITDTITVNRMEKVNMFVES